MSEDNNWNNGRNKKNKIMKNKQYIEKSKILNEIKRCLKCVKDPYEHNIYTNRLIEVYEDLIDFINDLKVKTIDDNRRNAKTS